MQISFTKNIFNGQFYNEYYLVLSLDFYELIHTFLDLKQLFLIFPLNFPNGVFIKEVCNGGVACSLLKLGSLEKTVIASLFHSGLHSGTIFCGKNDVICDSRERQIMSFFDKKKTKKFYDAKLIF